MPPQRSGIETRASSGGLNEEAVVSAPLTMLDDAGLVRPLERHDLPVVAGLAARRARHFGDPLGIDAIELAAALRGPEAKLRGLVAERFGHVVGYVLLAPAAFAGEGERATALVQLFVLESSRGLGLGRKLVAGAGNVARDQGSALLLAGERGDDARAAGFYRACGFAGAGQGGAGLRMRL
jgi:predicted N-acetyltransferase YhbS